MEFKEMAVQLNETGLVKILETVDSSHTVTTSVFHGANKSTGKWTDYFEFQNFVLVYSWSVI